MNRSQAPGRAAGPRLAVNYLPVQFTADSFPAGLVSYESADHLARLRTELSETHAVVRTGDEIACVPFVAEAPDVSRQATLDVQENLRLVMRLVQASLIGSNYQLRRFAPPTFVSRAPGRDLLAHVAQGHERELAGLHVYPQYSLDARITGPSGCPGIIVAVKTRYEIDLPASELLRRGVRVEGRYVLIGTGRQDHGLDVVASRRAAGAVDVVEGNRLFLRDAPDIQDVVAADAWLEGRRDVLEDVMRVLVGPACTKIMDGLRQPRSTWWALKAAWPKPRRSRHGLAAAGLCLPAAWVHRWAVRSASTRQVLNSDLIATLLGQLRHVKNWNADIVSTRLRASRWFV